MAKEDKESGKGEPKMGSRAAMHEDRMEKMPKRAKRKAKPPARVTSKRAQKRPY